MEVHAVRDVERVVIGVHAFGANDQPVCGGDALKLFDVPVLADAKKVNTVASAIYRALVHEQWVSGIEHRLHR